MAMIIVTYVFVMMAMASGMALVIGFPLPLLTDGDAALVTISVAAPCWQVCIGRHDRTPELPVRCPVMPQQADYSLAYAKCELSVALYSCCDSLHSHVGGEP